MDLSTTSTSPKKNLIVKKSEILYFLALGIYLFRAELVTTNFHVFFNTEALRSLVNMTVPLLVITKLILFDHYSVKSLVKSSCFLLYGLMASLISGYDVIFITILLIVGAKNIRLSNIVRFQFVISLSFVLASVFASQVGVIENTITIRDSLIRNSFGSIYATDFAAHIFYLIVGYCYIRGDRLSYFEIMSIYGLAYFIYHKSGARIDSITILTMATYLLWRKMRVYFEKMELYTVPKNAILINLMSFATPLGAIVSITMTSLYKSKNPFWIMINNILNNRLSQGAIAMEKYSFGLFGQIVEMQGKVGGNQNLSEYFFIDSSYLLIALRYGLIFLIGLCIGITVYSRREIKNRNGTFCILFLFIAINSIFSHHLVDLAYNPFILFFFTNNKYIPSIKGKKQINHILPRGFVKNN